MQLLKRRHKFTSQPNKRGPKNEKPRGKSRRRKSQGMRWHPFRSSWPQCWPQNAKPQKGAKCKSGKALHVIVNKFDCNGLEKSGGGKSVWQSGGGSPSTRWTLQFVCLSPLYSMLFLLIFLCLPFLHVRILRIRRVCSGNQPTDQTRPEKHDPLPLGP